VAADRRTARHAAVLPPPGSVARARLVLLGAVLVAALVLVAWFPARALLHQHASLGATASELSTLHHQDAAMAQERANLSAPGEIGRIAREQYQLVSPGQQAYEVLPAAGAGATALAGDPGAKGPVAPSATAVLPPGGSATSTTAPAGSAHRSTVSGTGASGSGFVARMVQTLEFWR